VLTVDRYELGPIGTNCYVVRTDRGAEEAVVVDPSGGVVELRLELARMGASVAAILLTHTHWDHFVGLAELAEGTAAPVYAPEVEREVLVDPSAYYANVPMPIQAWTPDHLLAGGESVETGGIAFEVVHVPGHSPGHLAYHADGCLFSGDVLFAGSIGRTDLPHGDYETLIASIEGLVARFSAETIVYPGHGPSTTLAAEVATNPFLSALRS
jgi:hydroxyacylglutathione hydrolase